MQCHNTTPHKHGKDRQGFQRYKCPVCGHTFTDNPKPRKAGRKPIGEKPMTDAERKRKQRQSKSGQLQPCPAIPALVKWMYHNKIQQRAVYQKTLSSVVGLGDKTTGIDIVSELDPMDIAILIVECEPRVSKEISYFVATADTRLMFESSYLLSVLGAPPYERAIEFGLNDAAIASYQEMWRSAGYEPQDMKV